MEELPRLSSTLAQGENTTGPKSNHHFYTNGNGRSKDSAERENEGIFFLHFNICVIYLLKKSTGKYTFHLLDGQ